MTVLNQLIISSKTQTDTQEDIRELLDNMAQHGLPGHVAEGGAAPTTPTPTPPSPTIHKGSVFADLAKRFQKATDDAAVHLDTLTEALNVLLRGYGELCETMWFFQP